MNFDKESKSDFFLRGGGGGGGGGGIGEGGGGGGGEHWNQNSIQILSNEVKYKNATVYTM